ncbi:ABC transporter ATP-binding protein [Pseudonocardia petroleophila]|uniref:ABC transporter ATP-binding protein n=1 Tax=Pseudonocardia petroleophila TaxID=37331 RepID=A0A7G7MLT7_9PSEU|nr:ABC transporter ATP-binding protein [Pseudonocardia petroleophila]QNG53748.1 ABC transporter ATP-binding protein [Pseudonocardia petroleophila]
MLDIEDLSISFGGVTALDGIGLQVAAGEICGLIGPNGAGKTTLFNCVTRVHHPSAGRIGIGDVDVLSLRRHEVVAHGIARTFQNLALFASMTVRENVLAGVQHRARPRLVAALVGWPGERARSRALDREVDALIDRIGLAGVADRTVAELPYGTLKRVELARALIARPAVVLLDEPAGGLTHGEVRELGELIRQVRDDTGTAFLLVEHHMGLVMSISDRVVAMEFGRVIAQGTPAEITRDPAVVASYLGSRA